MQLKLCYHNLDLGTFLKFFVYSSGVCLPEGLVDVTDCYYGFPIALSYPHFLDADPSLLEGVTGLTPNRSMHESFFVLNPVSIYVKYVILNISNPRLQILRDNKVTKLFNLQLNSFKTSFSLHFLPLFPPHSFTFFLLAVKLKSRFI